MITLLPALLLYSHQAAPPAALKPWKAPYEVVQNPESYDPFTSRLGPSGAGIFVKGDRATFIGKGAANPLVLPDWLRLSFTHTAEDLWVAQATLKDWKRFFCTYSIKDGEHSSRAVFRASGAPKAPRSAKTLAGSLQTIHFASRELGESRDLMVYLPPNSERPLNAVYMADGQSCASYAKVLEPLILAKLVAPTAIIGLFHGEYTGGIEKYDMEKDFRAREYLKVADPDRFASHLRFVTNEVMPWAERKFGLEPGREHRALFGFSNGAAFAVMASVDQPDIFGSVMPFSVAVFDRDDLIKSVPGKKLPRYYMAAGTLETFIRLTQDAAAILKFGHAKVRMDSYVTGHDQAMWELAFARALPKIFPYREN